MPRSRRSVEDRFIEKIIKLPSGCWEWTGATVPFGYGVFQLGRGVGVTRSHRFAYELWVGPIPEGMFVCHTCDNPPCCNPEHLFLGSNGDNMKDMHAKNRSWQRRRTHCPQGHPYDEENTWVDTSGRRRCRKCRRVHRRAMKEERGYWT